MEKKTNIKLMAILDGVYNTLGFALNSLNEDQIETINKRAEACASCPINRSNWCSRKESFDGINGCGCYIPLKIKSFNKDNKCPLKKW